MCIVYCVCDSIIRQVDLFGCCNSHIVFAFDIQTKYRSIVEVLKKLTKKLNYVMVLKVGITESVLHISGTGFDWFTRDMF